MPARYSGRLASVLDLHTRQGNSNKISGETTFSLISFKTSLEGPIVKERKFYGVIQTYIYRYLAKRNFKMAQQ